MKLHPRAVDLTSQKFGRLTALDWMGRRERNALVWRFQCDCGNIIERVGAEVTRGNCSSCGCYRSEVSRAILETKARPIRIKTSTTHGMSRTHTFYVWRGMRQRCYNPNDKRYTDYGGRGITVCKRWLDSFENFFADMGAKPTGMTLDRIEVNGNYEPSNCQWATPKTQARNRRNNVTLTHGGKTHTVSEWAEITKIGNKTIAYRLRKGWTVADALTTPVDHGNGWKNGNRS